MKPIKLSTKRQATFPKSLCDDLGLRPGDEIKLDKVHEKGEIVYRLSVKKDEGRPSWLGSLRAYAKGKSHDMDDIRASIAKGRKREWAERLGKIRP